MTKYRTRLLVGLITLIITVLLGLGLLLGQLFKTYYLNTFNERLKKETKMLSVYIEENGGLSTLDRQDISSMAEILHGRITISDLKANVLVDTGAGTDSASIERHRDVIRDIVSEGEEDNETGKFFSRAEHQYYWETLSLNGKKEGYIILTTKMSELRSAYSQIWWILSISLGLALVIIMILGIKIASRYTKPIESATNVAIELAKGNYRARTYEDHVDETGMLSASINILARNLQELVKSHEMQQDRLSTLIESMGSGLILIDSRGYINLINRPYKELFNVNPAEYLYRLYHEVLEHQEISALVEEIFMTEQKTRKQVVLTLSIERKYFEVYGAPIIGTNNVWKGVLLVFHDITELKKLEQMRKDFVANVSHELKTPITSIKGFSETLLDGAMKDQKALEAFLSIILKESNRLQSLIQDLLDLSKIEKQGFKLSVTELDLHEQISDVLAMLKGKMEEKKINLDFNTSNSGISIEGDPDRLKQVFINIINNAINYTPNGGNISIMILNQQRHVAVLVKDTGIGIEKDEIPRIFERFYRVDKARTRNSGGTGLGLAIVKHIIEAHKGSIEVNSEIGKGTVFTVRLHKQFPG